LLGACTVPQNAAFVSGVQEILGTEFPIVGGAASRSQFVYARGKVLVDSNLGILISGPFDLRFAGGTAPSRTTEEVIAVAGEVAGKAFGRERDDALVGLVCNCAGRHMELGTRQADEFARIKKAAGDVPLFGFYSNGEIGPLDDRSPAKGVGHHIIIAVMMRR
jgi:hypothetical protein